MTTTRLDSAVSLAKALAHPGRLRILTMLRYGDLCVCQMTAVLRLAPSTVSSHLSELRRAGLVVERKDARWVHYRLSDDVSPRRVLHEALGLVKDDPQIRKDAVLIRSIRRIPVERLCRAGLDLRSIGIRGFEASGPPPRARRRLARRTRHAH